MTKAPRTRWPLGFLGMVVLVGLAETVIASHPLRFCETASLSWRLAFEAIPREGANCEIACLGDSLVKIGVIPEVIRAKTGKSSYNFAMAQAPAPATYFLLRRLLESGGHPSTIVVDFKPSILTGSPKLSLRPWQEVLTLRESLELGRDSGKETLAIEILLGRALASMRYRLEIREAIVAAFRGNPGPTEQTNRLALRNWGTNRGAHLNSPRTGFDGQVSDELHGKLRSDDWRCHKLNALYIKKLFALAESRGIEVFWVMPPLAPALQARRERSGSDAAYVALARSMQARYPNLTLVDSRGAGYEDAVFADHTHLNGRGAMSFSHELAAILDRRDEQARWVALPRYRDWPTDVRAEDIDQSRMALKAQSALR
ncbi:hypothetical protein P12x_001370 [Tundrisphaera lichenicola]|uniref:hypothetical protein n=1 Tax=Tundrisphaera lichenicola TaxID=2029860 RepID=UPI003EB71893